MKEPVYEVFARKTREEPLRHIGWVNAMDGDLARVYAWKTYDEQNWAEMCGIPSSAILLVDPRASQSITTPNNHHNHGLDFTPPPVSAKYHSVEPDLRGVQVVSILSAGPDEFGHRQ